MIPCGALNVDVQNLKMFEIQSGVYLTIFGKRHLEGYGLDKMANRVFPNIKSPYEIFKMIQSNHENLREGMI